MENKLIDQNKTRLKARILFYADVTSVSIAFHGKKKLTPAISNNSIPFELGYHQRIYEKIAA